MTRRPGFVACILVLGLVAVFYNAYTYSQLFLGPNTSSMSSSTQDDREGKPGSGGDRDGSAPTRELAPVGVAVIDAFLGGLPSRARNPFRTSQVVVPAGPSEGSAPALPVVQGILSGEGRRVAWINGRARSAGEEIDGLVLRRIERDRVIVEKDGQEYELLPTR